MPVQRYKPEQIVTMLRQIEVGTIENGKTPHQVEVKFQSQGAPDSWAQEPLIAAADISGNYGVAALLEICLTG